ncbi:c-type cytochrome [Adhaeribacter radiodurans]|uniref:C-type cytochrome n=2 Tax=Adhaeribacter radiodurans TaxID=2745197 RepID=A0A7L7LF38_9BACT|nr:c-type cytochrome [Adhaeribacter radiodurans]
MNKQFILLAAFSFAFLTGCGSQTKQPGEEFYDSDYRAKADSAYEENQRNQPVAQAQPAVNTDTNSEKVGANASTHSAASEAPSAQADKSQASSPGKVAGTTPTETAAPAQTKPAATAGNFEKGKALLAKSDCLACHKIDQKIVGPAYQEVAKKYEANDKNITYLANKIIKGGAGVWGDVPMSPHPTLSQSDAKSMAQYILSLR